MISEKSIKDLARGDVIHLVASALQDTKCDCTAHEVCRSCIKKEVLRGAKAEKVHSALYKKAFTEQLDLSISGLPQATPERPITNPQKALQAGKVLTGELFRAIMRERGEPGRTDPAGVIREVQKRLDLENPNVHQMIKEYWEQGCRERIGEWLSRVV
jgi:hypothetical protein